MKAEHFKADLKAQIDQYQRLRMVKQCQEERATWTRAQEQRFGGAVSMMTDVLRDLRRMQEQWDKDEPAFLVTGQEERSMSQAIHKELIQITFAARLQAPCFHCALPPMLCPGNLVRA
jgi:hypothetical protein